MTAAPQGNVHSPELPELWEYLGTALKHRVWVWKREKREGRERERGKGGEGRGGKISINELMYVSFYIFSFLVQSCSYLFSPLISAATWTTWFSQCITQTYNWWYNIYKSLMFHFYEENIFILWEMRLSFNSVVHFSRHMTHSHSSPTALNPVIYYQVVAEGIKAKFYPTAILTLSTHVYSDTSVRLLLSLWICQLCVIHP